MADAVGSFVTRAFERMLKDASGRKNAELREALKLYLERVKNPEHAITGSGQQFTDDARHDISSEAIPTADGGLTRHPEISSVGASSSFFKRLLAPAATLMSPIHGASKAAEVAQPSDQSMSALVVVPLRLAIQTKQAKLVEAALDCFHKLIAFGLLEGVAGLNNTETENNTTELFNVICACADHNASDAVLLQVMKAILTAVASTTFEVHGECLLTAIMTCYNVALTSKSIGNQTTARSTLTQMAIIKCKKAENASSSLHSPMSQKCSTLDSENVRKRSESVVSVAPPNQETVEVSQAVNKRMSMSTTSSVSRVTLEELQFLASGSTVGGLEAALNQAVFAEDHVKAENGIDLKNLTSDERDALLVFRTICEMSTKDGEDVLVDKIRVLSLELLHGLLESVDITSAADLHLVECVKAWSCYALLRACVSPNPLIFQLSCNIFVVLMQRVREILKTEIAVFFPLIILKTLDGPEIPLQQQIIILKALEKLCLDPQLLADVFVNYDCDLGATNLIERMVNSLSKTTQGFLDIPEANPAVIEQITLRKNSSLLCLVNVLKAVSEWTAKLPDASGERDGEFSGGEASRGMEGADGIDLELREELKSGADADFGKTKAHKSSLEAAVAEFNRKPEKGIKALFEFKLAERDPVAVAQFLHTTPGLDKTLVGDYLGQHEAFQLSVMHAYVAQFNFSGMKFDQAIRDFLNGFRLPGEAQKIDRIMEKFAERFCHTNPGLFRNADTAYVLAYAVILLNTDAHNPMVWPKMSKADFVKINSGQPGDQQEHAPRELLEDLYDCIVKDEIKLKSDTAKIVPKKKELEEKSRLVTVLNLGQPKKKVADSKGEGEKIVQSTQDLLKKGGFKRGVFHVARPQEVARPMLDAVGWPLLATFSATMEELDDPLRVSLCMQGFRAGVHVTKVLGMDTMGSGFLTSLIRFTCLHSPGEVRMKNVEALRTLLIVTETEPDAMQDTWNQLLECVSRLEYITSSSASEALLQGETQSYRDALLQSMVELREKPTEQIFQNTVTLPSDVIVEFFTALCSVSSEELKQIPPRVFSLQKLVEISYYNMSRIRMVWAKIWSVLSLHFVAAGSHEDEEVTMYAIDSLRQLAIKYLERSELSNFSFQNDILRPFVILMRNSWSPTVRALIVDCIAQIIKSKITNIKSGWRSVFMVFTTAAMDRQEGIADIAFENVEQVILEHFDQVVEGCLMDCVNCLLAFASNKASSVTGLKAIALLSICEDRMAGENSTQENTMVGASLSPHSS